MTNNLIRKYYRISKDNIYFNRIDDRSSLFEMTGAGFSGANSINCSRGDSSVSHVIGGKGIMFERLSLILED